LILTGGFVMHVTQRLGVAAAITWMVMCSAVFAQEVKVTLSGSQEIPPVATSASGSGTIAVAADRTVTASVTVMGMTPTVAHIHEAPSGSTGPIVVPLVMTGDNVWSVPTGTKLTEAQFDAFRAGTLYFNIHSEAHRGGEIRGQIRP
jgi:hypothetical protein